MIFSVSFSRIVLITCFHLSFAVKRQRSFRDDTSTIRTCTIELSSEGLKLFLFQQIALHPCYLVEFLKSPTSPVIPSAPPPEEKRVRRVSKSVPV